MSPVKSVEGPEPKFGCTTTVFGTLGRAEILNVFICCYLFIYFLHLSIHHIFVWCFQIGQGVSFKNSIPIRIDLTI